MADLEPLIRYRKHIVDEKQRALSQLYRDAEQIELQKKRIEEQMEREKQVTNENLSPETMAYLGRYLEGARRKIEALARSLQKLDARINAAQEEVRAAFAEQKKAEIVEQQRKDAEKAAIAKKETNMFSDVAIERFHRRREDEDGDE